MFSAPLIGTRFQGALTHLLRGPFIETIALKRPHLEAIIRQFYDPTTDDPSTLSGYYLEAIEQLNFDLVNYLDPIVRRTIDPYEPVAYAIGTHNPQMIAHIIGIYPGVLANRHDMNFMLEVFILRNDPVAVQTIVELARPMINFERARQVAIGEGRENLIPYLS